MKIAVVVRNFAHARGGLEQYVISLVRGLVRRGHEVHVYARTWDQPEEPGVHFCRVPSIRKPAWLQALTFHWGVNRRLVMRNFDAVLGSGVVLFAPQHIYRLSDGVLAEWLRLRYPSPPVRWLAMIVRPVLAVNWWLERRLLNGRVVHLIANSRRYRDQAVRWYGIPADRISVIYNGHDPERFNVRRVGAFRREARQALGVPDDAPVALFVSQDFRRKGLDLLLRALPAVIRKNPRTWLVVVGRNKPGGYLRLARRLGIDRRVIFAGSLDTVEHAYVSADMLVLPTRFDPFANVCLEAMACGLPVVTTRINGAAELIRDGVNGYVVEEPEDVAGLADRICRLLDPAQRAALGREAARTAAPYTIDRHVKEIEQLFSTVRANDAPARALQASLRQVAPDLTVNEHYEALLERHGLHRFETLMGYNEGAPLKDRGGKRIFQLRLENKGVPTVLFLKRHRLPLSLWQRCLRWVGRAPLTEGRREWEHILAFHDRRLPTMTPVAMGERLCADGYQESFLVTQGLQEYESLERLAPKRFAPPLTPDMILEKRELIRAVATLTTQMHWSGFYHRDYYWAHVMVRREPASPTPDLRLIDLQRVIRFPWLRRRWQVKDLAALHYSLREVRLTRTDKLRFLRIYQASAAKDRRFMEAILRKTDKIARHDRALRNRAQKPR